VAFQSFEQFADFLRTTSRGGSNEYSPPAVNYLLEERLSAARERAFLGSDPIPLITDTTAWQAMYANYYSAHVNPVAKNPKDIHAFGENNTENHLTLSPYDPDLELIRVESMRPGYRGAYVTELDRLQDDINYQIQRNRGGSIAPNLLREDSLKQWLDEFNQGSGPRPLFATPYRAVEKILNEKDWLPRLRNALGMYHYRLKGGDNRMNITLMVMKYKLSRVSDSAKQSGIVPKDATPNTKPWFAIPTVLDAGGMNGDLGKAFFPSPQFWDSNNPLQHGCCVDLSADDPGEPGYGQEFVHLKFNYELGDLFMIGTINDTVTEEQFMGARNRHFAHLQPHFVNRTEIA
jgi:hypothetical protein